MAKYMPLRWIFCLYLGAWSSISQGPEEWAWCRSCIQVFLVWNEVKLLNHFTNYFNSCMTAIWREVSQRELHRIWGDLCAGIVHVIPECAARDALGLSLTFSCPFSVAWSVMSSTWQLCFGPMWGLHNLYSQSRMLSIHSKRIKLGISQTSLWI